MKTIRRDNPPAIFASVTGRSFVPPKDALLMAEIFRPEQNAATGRRSCFRPQSEAFSGDHRKSVSALLPLIAQGLSKGV